MPEIVLGLVAVASGMVLFVSFVCWITEGDRAMRKACLVSLVLSAGSVAWLAISGAADRTVLETTEYDVQAVHGRDGMVVQIAVIDGKPVNVNEELKASVPPGGRVRRTVYSGWRRGVYHVENPPGYSVVGGGE